jgi:diguanylate cyclase (GGDEF)-like protein
MSPVTSNRAEGADQPVMKNPRWGLRMNLIAGAITAGILALFVQGLWNERQEAWRNADLTARNLLTTLSRDISGDIASVDLALKGVIEGFAYEGFAALPPEIQHRMLFDRAVSATFTGTILLIDESGRLIADGGSVLAPRDLDFSEDEFFKVQEQRSFTGLYFSRPYRSRIRPGVLSLALSRRISQRDGDFAGVVAAEVALSDIHDLFQNLDVGPKGSIALFRSDGTLVMRQPYVADAIGRDFGGTANFQRFLREGSDSFQGVASTDQAYRLFTFSRIDDLPLILTVSQSADDILAPWWRRAVILAVITGVLCVAVVRLMFLFRRELGRRRRAEEELAQLASSDGLTGLPNRRTFDVTFEREWRQAIRSRSSLSLLFIDVDHFKGFNDHYGHARGDDVLCAIAIAIDTSIRRPRDLAARYGGEEFTVILPETDLPGAQTIAEAIRKAVAGLGIEHERSAYGIATVSVGAVTARPVQGMRAAGLLEAADAALYQAKAAGRNCVRVSDVIHGEATGSLRLDAGG